MTYLELIDFNYLNMWCLKMRDMARSIHDPRPLAEQLEKFWTEHFYRAAAIISHSCECKVFTHGTCSAIFVPKEDGITAVCPWCRRQYTSISGNVVQIPFEFDMNSVQPIKFSQSSSWIDKVEIIWRPDLCGATDMQMQTKEGKKFVIHRFVPFSTIYNWLKAESIGSFWHPNLKQMAKEI
ncbi:MAG: hypothetical protein UT24_C0030G0022 [Candidatus Woesebacteria bacterium GW2011_GWB1_39_12]|uniref:Uncharacterized protein n=1 Tax=Candidatus Woesebacteria bacterium GW2011_GWB1_39_12 TaxID=1618574 RepID=A0A0G0PLC7_9BACT|nr:MAG: hypothetical protein UT24_C0030G0022 [Candidatus Woesebacteria bacterium GW2011_GWB1_39_12]